MPNRKSNARQKKQRAKLNAIKAAQTKLAQETPPKGPTTAIMGSTPKIQNIAGFLNHELFQQVLPIYRMTLPMALRPLPLL